MLALAQSAAEAYLRTAVSIALPGRGWVDATDAARIVGSDLYVITAWNPGPSRPDLATNRERNDHLLARLQRLNCEIYPAIGASPEGDHHEESYAVVRATRDDVLARGREFEQAAIFEITPERLTVVSCDGRWERSRVIESADDISEGP